MGDIIDISKKIGSRKITGEELKKLFDNESIYGEALGSDGYVEYDNKSNEYYVTVYEDDEPVEMILDLFKAIVNKNCK
jgi:hypothetical protein